MKSFVFPAPFPTPPKEGAVAEGETALGPFTLAEAVRVFWSLKSLDLDMSISVKYSAGDTVYADVDERYDDLRPSANCTASLDPYKRCAANSVSLLEMERAKYTPHYGFTVSYPIMLPEENPPEDYAERMFAFPLNIYFGEDLLLLSSSALYGPEHLIDLYSKVPITIFGKTTEIFLLASKSLTEAPSEVSVSYSATASITPVFDESEPETQFGSAERQGAG